jgi:hypothetical protein
MEAVVVVEVVGEAAAEEVVTAETVEAAVAAMPAGATC